MSEIVVVMLLALFAYAIICLAARFFFIRKRE